MTDSVQAPEWQRQAVSASAFADMSDRSVQHDGECFVPVHAAQADTVIS